MSEREDLFSHHARWVEKPFSLEDMLTGRVYSSAEIDAMNTEIILNAAIKRGDDECKIVYPMGKTIIYNLKDVGKRRKQPVPCGATIRYDDE